MHIRVWIHAECFLTVWSSHIKWNIMILYKYSSVLIFLDTPMTTTSLITLPQLWSRGRMSHTIERKNDHIMLSLWTLYVLDLFHQYIFIKHTALFRKTERVIWWSDSPLRSQEIRHVLHFMLLAISEYTTFIIFAWTHMYMCVYTCVHMYIDVHVYST